MAVVLAFKSSDSRTSAVHRADWLLVGLLVCAGLAVRVFRANGSGLWRDEGLFVFVVDHPTWGGMLDFLRFHESHPPLFYVLMRIWRSMFGTSLTAAQARSRCCWVLLRSRRLI